MVLHKAISLARVFCHVTHHVQLLPTRMHLLPLYGDMFTPRPVSIYLDDLPHNGGAMPPTEIPRCLLTQDASLLHGILPVGLSVRAATPLLR